MNRERIEQITASLAVTFLGVATLGIILFIADVIFGWDIFPRAIERGVGFVLVSLVLIIASSVIVNIMINVGIIAEAARRLLESRSKQ